MLGGRHIQFPLERGRGSHKEYGNKVDTFLQLILPVILYSDFCLAFLMQKLDAHPRCHCETLSSGQMRGFPNDGGSDPAYKHSHLMLKEAFVEWSASPVTLFSATHSKLPASSSRSTAVNLRLLPSWKRLSLSSMGWPLWSQL